MKPNDIKTTPPSDEQQIASDPRIIIYAPNGTLAAQVSPRVLEDMRELGFVWYDRVRGRWEVVQHG